MAEAFRAEIERIKAVEAEKPVAKWDGEGNFSSSSSDSSPKGVVDNAALIQRYEEARNLYLQRRLENLLVDHISTFDPESKDNPFELPEVEDAEDLKQRHADALNMLQTSVQQIRSKVIEWKDKRETLASRREEIENMLQDFQVEGTDGDNDVMDTSMDDATIDENTIKEEQERIDQLQRKKRELKERLAKLQREAAEAQERSRAKKEQVALLQQSLRNYKHADQAEQHLQELKDMKEFYDSLREALEEIGGVKILRIEEDSNRRLILTLLFCQAYTVQITMEVFQRIYLKLVDAKWVSEPTVRPRADQALQETKKEVESSSNETNEDFFLSMDPLTDLVQAAKATLGPPHDLRFIVRETLARILIAQNRVEELADLRQKFLMKVYNGNQVLCSLNEGILIIMKLYEKYTKLDQLEGIMGWDDGVVQSMKTAVIEKLQKDHPQDNADVILNGSKVTPLMIVQYVQNEVENQQSEGTNPRTPRFPVRGAPKGF